MSWKAETYSGWGRVLRASGRMARPERLSALTRLLAQDVAPAIGQCRSYGDACLNDDGAVINMQRMNRVLGFDEKTGILTAEAGVRIGDIADLFAPKGWLPAVMPGTGFATVGGAIAMDVHGKNHHTAGSFGQHVVELTLIQNGTTKIVTPKDDLFRATVGGLGQTGVIASAKLQLMACKGDVMMVTERRAQNWDSFIALLDASEATYSVGWIDATATGAALGRGILEEGETGAGLVPHPKAAKKIPLDAPHWALSAPIVRAFNALYFRRVPTGGRTVVKPIQDFFFPLDKIHGWNRLYGKRGFHQFQCVVPLDQAHILKEMLDQIARSGLASPLAVLKRMGPGRAGMMSFPMEGYTLAVDFPARDDAQELIAALETRTAEIGGRLYFAKDALAGPEMIDAMYPERRDWAAQVAKIDPKGQMETDLVRRLSLREIA